MLEATSPDDGCSAARVHHCINRKAAYVPGLWRIVVALVAATSALVAAFSLGRSVLCFSVGGAFMGVVFDVMATRGWLRLHAEVIVRVIHPAPAGATALEDEAAAVEAQVRESEAENRKSATPPAAPTPSEKLLN